MAKRAVLCLGAAHWDLRAQGADKLRHGTSNPVRVARYAGGVAHNVAVNLCRLDLAVGLVSRWGDDEAGDRLARDLKALGIEAFDVPRCREAPTATYTAVLEPDGELAFGLADMAIYDSLDPALLAPLLPRFAGYPLWFMDANLPGATLAALAQWKADAKSERSCFLAADAVSVAKAPKLEGALCHLDLLFCNRDELETLTDREIAGDEDLIRAGEALLQAGPAALLVTEGASGARLFTAAGCRHFPAPAATVKDVTGAGDALIAGTLAALAEGKALGEAVPYGLAAAAIAVENKGATAPDLNRTRLHAFVATPDESTL